MYVYISREEYFGFSLAIQQLLTMKEVRAVGARSSLQVWDCLGHSCDHYSQNQILEDSPSGVY